MIDCDLDRLHQVRRTTRVLSNAAKEVSRKGWSVWTNIFLCIIIPNACSHCSLWKEKKTFKHSDIYSRVDKSKSVELLVTAVDWKRVITDCNQD